MNLQLQTKIKEMIVDRIRAKLKSYNPETTKKPFHYRLLGKDRMALYSFIHSLNTTLGMSIYEQIAVSLASKNFKVAETQVKPYNKISIEAQRQLETIINELIIKNDRKPNRSQELHEIREVCQTGELKTVNLTLVDVWLENDSGELFLIDLKTAKPNIDSVKGYKRTILEWTAAELARKPEAKVSAIIGIPYNPYEPEPYNRWTLREMLDVQQEILLADELWNFIGGVGTYNKLLDAFEMAGIELRDEIDAYFNRFK